MTKKNHKTRNILIGTGVVLAGIIAIGAAGEDETPTDSAAPVATETTEAVVEETTTEETAEAVAEETTEPEPVEELATVEMPDLVGLNGEEVGLNDGLLDVMAIADVEFGEGADLPAVFSTVSSTEPAAGETVTEGDTVTIHAEAAGDLEQRNAVESALSYIDYSGFSKAGLTDQLASEYGEDYPRATAEWAVQFVEDRGLVDWNEEAAESAQSYLDYSSFSRAGLIDQLTSEYGEQFTKAEAEYAAKAVGF